MMSHQIAHQLATFKRAHETQIHAEMAEIMDETPLTHQLFLPFVGEAVCLGHPL